MASFVKDRYENSAAIQNLLMSYLILSDGNKFIAFKKGVFGA